jgi:hypothetical protein
MRWIISAALIVCFCSAAAAVELNYSPMPIVKTSAPAPKFRLPSMVIKTGNCSITCGKGSASNNCSAGQTCRCSCGSNGDATCSPCS